MLMGWCSLLLIFSVGWCRAYDVSECPLITNKTCQRISHEEIERCLSNSSYDMINNIVLSASQLASSLTVDSVTTTEEKTINAYSSTESNEGSVCQWKTRNRMYNNTIPHFIAHAECNSSAVYFDTSSSGIEYRCSEVIYPVNVLKWRCGEDNQIKWTVEAEDVVFGCALVSIR